MVTHEIQESWLAAESLGLSQMRTFVDKRLCQPPDSDMHLDLKAPIQKNQSNQAQKSNESSATGQYVVI